MKKLRILSVLIAIFCMLTMFAACQAPEETEPSYTGEVHTFDALVLEITPQGIRVGPMSGELEIAAAADKGLMLNRKLLNGEKITDLESGMLIRVTYNGSITYSLPAQINGVISVEVLEQGT